MHNLTGLVHIFDRQGEQYDEIGLDLSAPVIALEWDPDGSTLAILQMGSSVVPLWDLASRSTQNLDSNQKDPTFIRWNSTGNILAIGTSKGNLVLYSKGTRKMVPVLGKHSKKITCGVWNSGDELVLGSEDKMITLSNSKGDTIEQRELSAQVGADPERDVRRPLTFCRCLVLHATSPSTSSLGASAAIP